MAIDKATLKEMVGKRITIDGVKHRVEKVVTTKGLIITRDGTEALADGVYKKGPGFFYDSPKGSKKKAAATKAEAPVKETARARRAREKAEADVKETAREKRARLKREAAGAEDDADAKQTRVRRRSTDKTPGAKGDGAKVPSKKKKLFEAFDQAVAERISQESFDLLAQAYGDKGDYAITPVAVGAAFDNDALKITITVMSAGKSAKEIKNYIRDHREATDIASDDEEDDDLDDDDLEDDDADDSLEEEDDDSLEDDEEEDEETFLAELNALSRADLRKIAKDMEIDDYKDFSKEDLAQELSEYEESDVRESAANAGVELGDGDEEDELSDDEDEEEDDDSEDDDSEEDDEEETATVEDLVGEVLEVAPELKAKSITKFVEAFLANDECQEKFDGELVPGRTKLQEKGGKGPEMLLIGFDEAGEAIKLLNLDTLKTRSKTISEVVHMEILDDAE